MPEAKQMQETEEKFEEAVEELFSKRSGKKNPAKKSTRKSLELLDNPEEEYKVVLVGGTNGKGSVVEMLSELLQHQDKKVGTYKSPHLTTCRERMQVNGDKISRKNFLELYTRIDSLDTDLSFFEFMTIMAYTHFAEKDVDYAVMEVGMGGRLDATNVVEPELSVITNVGEDHKKYLGETVEERAREKAGIIHSNPVILGEMQETLIEVGEEKGAEIFGKKVVDGNANTLLDFEGEEFHIPVRGSFQSENLGTALSAIEKLEKIPEDLDEALSDLECPGRMEVKSHDPLYIQDGAHNPSAVEKIVEDLPEGFVCVFNATETKDYAEMISILEEKASKFFFTESEVKWATEEAEKLGEECSIEYECVKDPEKAMVEAKDSAGEYGCVVATGSLYLLGSLRE